MENRLIAEIEAFLMVSPLKSKFLLMGKLKSKHSSHVKINPKNWVGRTSILKIHVDMPWLHYLCRSSYTGKCIYVNIFVRHNSKPTGKLKISELKTGFIISRSKLKSWQDFFLWCSIYYCSLKMDTFDKLPRIVWHL